MSTLNQKAISAIVVTRTEKQAITVIGSWPKLMLADLIESVDAIPADSMPAQKDYVAFGDAQNKAFKAMFKRLECGLPSTMANNHSMIVTAAVAALSQKADKLAALARHAAAVEALAEKDTKANANKVKSAAKALEKANAEALPTSLDAASKRGKVIGARKTNKIKLRNQKPTNKGTKHANPTKAATDQAAKDKTAHLSLVSEALAYAVEVSGKGDKATDRQRLVALKGVASVADHIVKYLGITI